MAEKDGQISLLGEQVFRKVCHFIKDHDEEMHGVEWINVNVSPYQFLDNDMPGIYLGIINECGVPVSKVHFELTEESIVDYSLLKVQLSNMNEAGFKFVLDDYGSGYSNLIRLRSYSFDNIKIDMEIVWDYCDSPSPILPAFIKAIREMGHSVTAEGIENETMAQMMLELGCDYQQGYAYSRPLPADEFLEYCSRMKK
jgi:EAL domain-containing protein (putative c-di-GMP-specific phosphodiesterase class I)